jgi:hypothetical protein
MITEQRLQTNHRQHILLILHGVLYNQLRSRPIAAKRTPKT